MEAGRMQAVVSFSAKGLSAKDPNASQWIDALLTHSQIDAVFVTGNPPAGLAANSARLRFFSGDEREAILKAAGLPDTAAVLRLNHQSSLRFPLTHRLLDDTFAGYDKHARGGYFQLDLADMPYPYLAPEVLGRGALDILSRRPDFPLDWNFASSRLSGGFGLARGGASLRTRQEYFEHPGVEYFSFPKFMALESSRLCNLRCTMCVTHSDFIDHSHLDRLPKHFDMAKYDWILDQMIPYREYMSIAPQFQGEPFMSPHIKEMIQAARRKGFLVGFTSNATLWNDEIIDFMIDQGVYSLCVSLDGATKESYERVRIGANFETVIRNLNKLVARKIERAAPTPYLSVNMTLMPENRHQVDQLLDDWLGKATMVSINNTCINHVVPEKFHQPERYPCPFLWEGLHILTNGDVIACCRDSDYEEVMGNAYETPILEIWNGEKYRRFRSLHALGRWNEIPMCARCDTWMCKTKKTLAEGGRMMFQYPFFRQYFAMGNTAPQGLRGMMDEFWGALKNSSRKLSDSLITLNPLRRAS